MGREAKAKKDRTIRSTGANHRGTATEVKAIAGTVERLNKLGFIAPSQDVKSNLVITRIPDELGGDESWS